MAKDRVAILGQIRNPLIFFSLALLLIEGIIGLVVTKSGLTEILTFVSICIMAFLFLVVVAIVSWITIKWPRHLYEEVVQELETTRSIKEYIESPAFTDTIEDIIFKKVKQECLENNN